MTCEHRNVTAIPGGRYACADTLNCCATFTLSSGRGEVDDLREELDLVTKGYDAQVQHGRTHYLRAEGFKAQRDSARDCAVILEQMLAEADEQLAHRTKESRLDTEKWSTP